MTDDVIVYPADEEEQHDLYSAKCKCKPTAVVFKGDGWYTTDSRG